MIKEAWSGDMADAEDIGEADLSSLGDFDGLVVGAPTWHTGADEFRSGTSWDDLLEEIKGLDLSGKKVAVFGCGDSSGYGDYFCDAIEEIHTTFAAAGATMVGNWAADGSDENHTYDFVDSKSCTDGVFLGLPECEIWAMNFTDLASEARWRSRGSRSFELDAIVSSCSDVPWADVRLRSGERGPVPPSPMGQGGPESLTHDSGNCVILLRYLMVPLAPTCGDYELPHHS